MASIVYAIRVSRIQAGTFTLSEDDKVSQLEAADLPCFYLQLFCHDRRNTEKKEIP